jgi:WD40 repeat protein
VIPSPARFFHQRRIVDIGAADRSVRLWDVKTGREIANLSGHKGGVTGISVSPDGLLMASASTDGSYPALEPENL